MRFADASGKLLPFWIETNLNAAWTIYTTAPRIWVRVPTVNQGNNATTIYMYYNNNASMVSQNNGALTFDYWQDNLWFHGSYYDSSDTWLHGFSSSVSFNRPFILEYAMCRSGGNYAMVGIHQNNFGISYGYLTYAAYLAYDGNGNRILVYEDGNSRGDNKRALNASSWEYWKQVLLPGAGCMYSHAYTLGAFVTYYSSGYSAATPLKVGLSNLNMAMSINAFRVRKYANPEPSAMPQGEETGTWNIQVSP
jgi:hypothetical protein